MPDIDKKIKEQLQKVDERLADLPELPNENVQHVVRERLADFSNGVQRLIEGGPQSNEFLSSWSELSNDFRDAIQSMKPMFNYNDKSDMALPEVINLDDDSDDETASKMSAPSFTPSKRSNESATMPNSKRPKIYNDSAIPFNRDSVTARSNGVVGLSPVTKPKQETGLNPPTPRRIIPPPKSQTQTSDKRTTFFDAFLGSGRNFMKICEVRQNILKHARPGLPDHVDDFVKEDICLQSIQPWDDPLNVLADRTFTMLGTAIEQMLLKTLGMYQQTDLYRTSHRHIRQFLDDHFAKQRKVLDDFFELETYKRFTINDAAFATYRAEELKILEAARRGRRARCYIITEATMAKKALTDEQKTDRAKKITDEQLGPDPFQKEIDLAAYVRGYYKTAAYRFTDNVCQNIQGTIFRKIHKEIKYLLERCLKLDIGDGKTGSFTILLIVLLITCR
jgi:hypothetical protein